MSDLYKRATKQKLRFASSKGQLTVEQLYDLPLSGQLSLDTLAKGINRELKNQEEESFVETSTNRTGATLRLKLDILKDIIADKLAAKESAEKRAQNKAKKDKLLRLLAAKEDQEMEGMSKEDIIKQIEELDAA